MIRPLVFAGLCLSLLMCSACSQPAATAPAHATAQPPAGSEPAAVLTPPPALKPLYANDFSALEIGSTPQEFLIIHGTFSVAQDGENKLLHLPVQGLEEHGFLFGPVKQSDYGVQARIRAVKYKRQYPLIGVGLNGLEGVRLKCMTAAGKLELSLNGVSLAQTDFAWESGQWTWLRLQNRAIAGGAIRVEAKAWKDGAAEPAEWMVAATITDEIDAGRASVWSAPFAKTVSDMDDIAVLPAAP